MTWNCQFISEQFVVFIHFSCKSSTDFCLKTKNAPVYEDACVCHIEGLRGTLLGLQ